MTQSVAGKPSGKYVPPIRFGLGGVPLGNEFEVITDEDAYRTLDAAWSAGLRYYDVSPWYGLGLAERRFGYYLHNKNRNEYVLSSKVGKLLKASRRNDAKSNFPFSPSPNNVVFDYTADGVRRSVEDSLQRLGIEAGRATEIPVAVSRLGLPAWTMPSLSSASSVEIMPITPPSNA